MKLSTKISNKQFYMIQFLLIFGIMATICYLEFQSYSLGNMLLYSMYTAILALISTVLIRLLVKHSVRTVGKRSLYMLARVPVKLLDCIIPLLTLGFYFTDLEYSFIKWQMFRTAHNPQRNADQS